ncbi:hypothetical protein MLD52_02300 [Puniceicoccaceae bacterium K14]|nr:hypothetical protein [Puniceicoccaceae bacterium K14]
MKWTHSEKDLEFKRLVESCEYPIAAFNHRAHLRLAYVYLSISDSEYSVEQMRRALSRLLQHNGVDPSKYHETLTKSWIFAVYHFMNQSGSSSSADELIDAHPEMLDAEIMLSHYSAEVLFSEKARKEFVEPNLTQIPSYDR